MSYANFFAAAAAVFCFSFAAAAADQLTFLSVSLRMGQFASFAAGGRFLFTPHKPTKRRTTSSL